MSNTSQQYDEAAQSCRDIFEKKMKDYGSSWRILRISSITDQMYIKAKRIRSLEEKGVSRVDEGIEGEFKAIVNYGIMGMVQLEEGYSEETNLAAEEALNHYDHYIGVAKGLMENKNHDYDEAWREMRTSSLTDMILQKLLRTKQIEENKGKTLISEGIDANYLDMINYAIFALIQLNEKAK
ncbi:MAG: DUF1599 domain-containing protein [Vicingaceae bacterium]